MPICREERGTTLIATSKPSVNIKGRLSFPRFTMQEALDHNAMNTKFKKDPANVTPSFGLLLEEEQLNKVIAHLTEEFIPMAEARYNADADAKNVLRPKDSKKIIASLEARDFADQPPYIPLKPVGEKTLELMPSALALDRKSVV